MICFYYSTLTAPLLIQADGYSKWVGNWKLVYIGHDNWKSYVWIFCSVKPLLALKRLFKLENVQIMHLQLQILGTGKAALYTVSQCERHSRVVVSFVLIFSACIWGVPKRWGLWVYCCISCQRNQRLEGEDGDFSRLHDVQIQRWDFPSPYPFWS